jgi:hypothetical protein
MMRRVEVSDIKDRLRPILLTFSRSQLIICHKLSRLPRGEQVVPEWIFAVALLGRDQAAIDALSRAVDSLTHRPSFDELMAIAMVTKDLNRVLEEGRRQNGPTPGRGFRRGPRAMR